jgi:hypothetical protein
MKVSNNSKDNLSLGELKEQGKANFCFVTKHLSRNTANQKIDVEYVILKLIKKFYKYKKKENIVWIQRERYSEEPKNKRKMIPITTMIICGYILFCLKNKGEINYA